MSHFKAGDYVKCICDEYYGFVKKGDIYKVKKVNSSGNIQLEHVYDNGHFFYDANDFVHADPASLENIVIPLRPGIKLRKWNHYKYIKDIVTVVDINAEYNIVDKEITANVVFQKNNGAQFVVTLKQQDEDIILETPTKYAAYDVDEGDIFECNADKIRGVVTVIDKCEFEVMWFRGNRVFDIKRYHFLENVKHVGNINKGWRNKND